HGEIVDVDLAARLLELAQQVGGEPADHLLVRERHHEQNLFARQQVAAIIVARRVTCVSAALVEHFAEQSVEGAQPGQVARSEAANREVQTSTAVPLTLTISIDPFWPSTS